MSEPMVGQRTCSNGHQVRAAARFCPTCGVNTAPPEGQQTGPTWPTADLSRASAASSVPPTATPPTATPADTWSARYGPNGQTCTDWSLTHQLTGELLIVRTTGTNQPC